MHTRNAPLPILPSTQGGVDEGSGSGLRQASGFTDCADFVWGWMLQSEFSFHPEFAGLFDQCAQVPPIKINLVGVLKRDDVVRRIGW